MTAVQTDNKLVDGVNDAISKHIKQTANDFHDEEIKMCPDAVGTIMQEDVKKDQMILVLLFASFLFSCMIILSLQRSEVYTIAFIY